MPEITVPVGPQHPALKEPVNFRVVADGETIVRLELDVSYNHRGIEKAAEHSQRLATWARLSSPWVTIFNSGACNACDIEIIACLTPRFDVERFGILAKGSPRHADILIVTGPVTRKQAPRLRRIWEQMPEPKYVIAMGACGSHGGVFQGLYHVLNSVEDVVPVDVYVAGCPPRPDEIINAVVETLRIAGEDLKHGSKEWRKKQPARPAAPPAPAEQKAEAGT